MIPVYRFLEVALYSLLSFTPFLLLAIAPFRHRLRFSVLTTSLLFTLLGLLQILTGLLAAFSPISTGVLSLVTPVLCAIFYFTVIKGNWGLLAFVLLALTNVANMVSILAKFLEGVLFGQMALGAYRWSLCLCLLLLHVVITIPLFFFIRKYFVTGLSIQTKRWNYFWLIPATFYFIWYYHLYLGESTSLHVALDFHNAIFILCINAAAFLVYHTAILLLIEQKNAAELLQKNYQLSLQELQYDSLQQRINEARQAKHDLHHHTHLIREYLRSNKFQELEDYLDEYSSTLPDTQALVYCRHYAVNTLLSYFCQQAKSKGVETDVFVQLPEKIDLPETTFSVVLGNLFENAIDACASVAADKRRITVRGKATSDSVFFEIANPYEGELHKTKSGNFLSTKATNRGLGLESVASLAKAHNGILEVEAQNGVFSASVLLMMQKTSG